MHTLSQLRSGELQGTARLKLRGGLTAFPPEIFELADTLEILDLSENRLSSLPGDLGRLHRLKILFCSANDFERLPSVLGECPALEMVGFKSNRIATVDESSFPTALRWLILTDNRLARLPDSIGNCPRLQKLMLAGNQLEHLPESMARCVNLELVRLSANRFREFPPWLFELPRLSWLGLGGNPCCPLPVKPAMREIAWTDLRLGEPLGEGASGVIFRAHWAAGERPVAVKLFKGGMTSDGLPQEEMAVCLAAGSHPNLIGALGKLAHHPDEQLGLVMPLIDPELVSLAGPPDFDSCTRDVYADDCRFDLRKLLRIANSLASAARHLHERGITHGDFYAHNILLDSSGGCLLGDFGAASFYPAGLDLERVEVRAFGCLLEELLTRVEDREAVASLWELQKQCVAVVVSERPDFAEIEKSLARSTALVVAGGGGVEHPSRA